MGFPSVCEHAQIVKRTIRAAAGKKNASGSPQGRAEFLQALARSGFNQILFRR
jgi:hypothetical protein